MSFFILPVYDSIHRFTNLRITKKYITLYNAKRFNHGGDVIMNWQFVFENYFNTEEGIQLMERVEKEYQQYEIFPPKNLIFNAFELTPFDQVRVVILGQDPYHDEGQAHGLAFSVVDGVKLPPSLRNIFKEIEADLGISPPTNGDLTYWAQQGVLLLNTCLTVRAHQANSHKAIGWDLFTDYIISELSQHKKSVIFVLWGKPAQQKKSLIDDRHPIIESPHPSPLAAYRGFFGSKPFSQINQLLEKPIIWVKEKENDIYDI